MAVDSMACYLVSKDDSGQLAGRVTQRPLADLPAGDVLVRVAYSSLNYKDGLSASGHPGVTRVFPHVPGIDVVGTVESSRDPAYATGDPVLVTGYDMGQNTWGGFAEFIQVPAAWVLPLPKGLSPREAMIYGTAGLTAGMSLAALQQRGVTPERGEIVVTGATGGVGSLAIAILARAGYRPVAVTGKAAAHEYLQSLGAVRCIGREEVHDTSTKPMLASRWAGAIDTVGGVTLSTIVRSLNSYGCVAICGLVGGTDLPLTVYPFILRGVDLVGIDSALCPVDVRQTVWQKLAGDWKSATLEKTVAAEATLDDVGNWIAKILAGGVTGRVLVKPETKE